MVGVEMEGQPPPPFSATGTCDRDRASPKRSSPKIVLNRRALYRESQKIPISSPKVVSPMKLGLALS